MDIVVTGIGLVSALGDRPSSWHGLLAEKSGIWFHQPFPKLAPRPLALIGTEPSDLTDLTRRVVADAIADAGLVAPLPDCGVVLGSSRGHQGRLEQLAQQFSRGGGIEGNTWRSSLPGTIAVTAAQQIGSQAAVLAPMAACATGLWAIAQGVMLLETGQCQRVIVGAVEAPITPLTLTGFQQMGALASTGAYPFDRRREGLVLGEGGAVLVLEQEELARQRSAPIYGRILGFGLTADGYHVSAPEPGSPSAIAAVRQCLERSRLRPGDIDYIHAHGTATQLNDRNEAHLIQQVFPPEVPVSSTKGATGHTIGASGALGLAFCLLALQHQLLPPNVGLREPEFPLDLVQSPRPASIRHALCFSFGFGGQNAVVAVGAP